MDTKRFCLLVSLLAGFMLISLLLHLLSSQPSSAQVGKVSVEVPFPDAGYCFLRGLITPTTSLVRSREGECFTTIYKNSLAAMAFIHQGDITQAEGIFSFFQNQITATTPISGFHKDWDACEGSAPADNPPTYTNPYWVGDNAFLLLALNYYSQTRKIGSYGAYDSLATVLSNAVTLQANSRVITEAEGIADIYAALQLEAIGFSIKGKGWKLAEDGEIELNGKIPCATMGGMKARGFAGGASGVYQAVEATIQLRGQAEANQIHNAKVALIQNLGGPASTAVSHILQRLDYERSMG